MRGNACIKSILRRSDGTFCVIAEVSNESGCESIEFVILCELFEELCVNIGEIDEEILSSFDRCAEMTAAYSSACASIAFTQGSLMALYRKLIGKGYSKDASLGAIEIVKEHGFVDECDIARRRAEIMLSKLWGRTRIMQKLREEGFPDEAIEEASISLDQVDFAKNCARVIEKKFYSVPEDRHERDKMFASLMRLGYSSADIKRAVRLVNEE